MSEITSGNQFNDDALQETYQGAGKVALAAMILIAEMIAKALNKNKIEITQDNVQPDLTVEKNSQGLSDLTVEKNEGKPLELTVEKNEGVKTIDEVINESGKDEVSGITVEKSKKARTIDAIVDETSIPKKPVASVGFEQQDSEEFPQQSSKKKPEVGNPDLENLEDENFSKSDRSNPLEQSGTQPSVLFGKVDGKFVNTLDDKQAKAIADMIAAPPGTQIPGAEGLTIRYKGVIIAQTNEEGIVEVNTVHDKISEKDIQMLQDTIQPANPIGLDKAVKEQKKVEKEEDINSNSSAPVVPTLISVPASVSVPSNSQESSQANKLAATPVVPSATSESTQPTTSEVDTDYIPPSATKVTPLEALGIEQPVASADILPPTSESIIPNSTVGQSAPPIKKSDDLGDMPVEETGYAKPPDDIDGRFREEIKPPAPEPPKLRNGNAVDRIETVQSENIAVPGMAALSGAAASQAPLGVEQIGKFSMNDIEGSSTREVAPQSKDKIANIANWIEQNTSEKEPEKTTPSGGLAVLDIDKDGAKTYSLHNANGEKVFSATESNENNQLNVNTYNVEGVAKDYKVILDDTNTLRSLATDKKVNEPTTATPESLDNLQQLVEKEAVPRMDGDTFLRERGGVQTKVENQGDNRKVSLTDMENPSAPLSFTYNSKTNDIVSVESDKMTPAIAKEVKTLEAFLEQSKVVTVPATDEIKKANGAALANDNKLNDEIENKVSVGLQSDEGSQEAPKPVVTSNFIPEPGASQQVVAPGQPTPTKPTPEQTSLVSKSKAIIDRLSMQEGHTVTDYENLQLSSKEKEGSIKYDVSDTKSQARLSFTADSKTGNVTEIQEFQSEQLKPKMDKLEKDNSLKEDPNYNNIVTSNSQQISKMASVTNTQDKFNSFASANLKEDKVPEIGGKPLVPGQQKTAKPLTGGVVRRKPAGMTQG